jgi:hypothetical protein
MFQRYVSLMHSTIPSNIGVSRSDVVKKKVQTHKGIVPQAIPKSLDQRMKLSSFNFILSPQSFFVIFLLDVDCPCPLSFFAPTN